MSTSPAEPSVDQAPVLHVDLDAFFASVEVLDDPTLAGKPVAVGGGGARGVVASASYEARRYGVRSAMPSVTARRLCPDLIMLPGRFDRYEEYSRRFHALVSDLTPDYEPLGLDEVFADLRGLRRLEVAPIPAAHALRARIRDELSLRSGVGLARNKLFAKLASREAKPRVEGARLVEGPGVVWVSPATEARWLDELEVGALWGVGPATAAKLGRLGLTHVRDLRRVDEATLAAHFGPALAATLAAYAVGEDRREVEPDRVTKSMGHEQTFAVSLHGLDQATARAREHAAVVARALRGHGLVARTVSIHVRYDDLTNLSRAQTLPFGLDDEEAIGEVAVALLETVDLSAPVRLLGVHASGLKVASGNAMQLSFGVGGSADPRERALAASLHAQVGREGLRDALDEVRRRFGRSAVGAGSDLGDDGVEVGDQRGRSPFGPETPEG